MGTHPIFESDFDCLTEEGLKMSSDVAKEKEMLKADLYGLIGVTKMATDGEIKKVLTFVWRRKLFS